MTTKPDTLSALYAMSAAKLYTLSALYTMSAAPNIRVEYVMTATMPIIKEYLKIQDIQIGEGDVVVFLDPESGGRVGRWLVSELDYKPVLDYLLMVH